MSYLKDLAFGLDLGDRSLKAIQFRTRKQETYLMGFGEIALPEGILEKGEILQAKELAKHIQALLHKTRISGKRVVLALPEAKSFVTTLNLPNPNSEMLGEHVKMELAQHIPYDLEDVWWNFQVIAESPTEAQVLIGAAPKPLVETYKAAVQQAGLIPIIFDLEPLSIARSMLSEKTHPDCVVIVDLGATKSTVIIAGPQTIFSTADGRSPSSALDYGIAQTLKIDLKAAEEMKYKFGAKEGTAQYLDAVKNYLTPLADKIKSTVSFALDRNHACPAISEILLSGGGSLLKDLPDVLTNLLHIPVKLGDPWVNTRETIGIKIGKETGVRFTTACGLALAGLNQTHTL